MAFYLMWYIALAIQVSLCFLYAFKCIFYFDLVKEEFSHYIGVNYLYAPFISCLLLLQSAPLMEPHSVLYKTLFWVFVLPVLTLDTKLYGQWFTTEKRFLSIMANPASQVSVIANLVAARGAAEMGWKECALCLFSLGMVHYLVIFVTLYQRLPGGNNFPTTLRPVSFLFFAAPATGNLAWNSICGTFDTVAKMLFFLSLFIFVSLAGSWVAPMVVGGSNRINQRYDRLVDMVALLSANRIGSRLCYGISNCFSSVGGPSYF
ncbi:hypothetical protein F2Q69_00013852 [Brassica cretica]|uniref:Uncharacterized protein n=1 Tax=Brassica cretica TaxID=69181 RepID=A0A8S9QTH4_BRACR|nr:hypothetical protein F2Q69_00013852 [Brassica cretica]